MRQTTSTIGKPVAELKRAIQFSIRELLFAVAGVGCVLGGFSMCGWLGASSIALVIGFFLVVRGGRAAKPRLSRFGIALSIPSFCISTVMLAGWLLFDIGPIFSHAAWPHQLRRMAEIGNVKFPLAMDCPRCVGLQMGRLQGIHGSV